MDRAFSSPLFSRATAVALLLGVLFVVYSLTLAPVLGAYAQVNGAIAQTNELLVRYRQIASQRPVLEKQLERIAAKLLASGVYLEGDTDALAAARLQEIVNAKVESGGGRVRSVQILPSKADGDFRRVGVRVQMSGNITAVARILYAFEAGDTYLFVDNIEVNNRKSRRRRNGDENTDPELLIRLDLTGYVRPEVAG